MPDLTFEKKKVEKKMVTNNEPELHEIIRDEHRQDARRDWSGMDRLCAGGYRALLRLFPSSQYNRRRCSFFDEELGRDGMYIAGQCAGHALQALVVAQIAYCFLK